MGLELAMGKHIQCAVGIDSMLSCV